MVLDCTSCMCDLMQRMECNWKDKITVQIRPLNYIKTESIHYRLPPTNVERDDAECVGFRKLPRLPQPPQPQARVRLAFVVRDIIYTP